MLYVFICMIDASLKHSSTYQTRSVGYIIQYTCTNFDNFNLLLITYFITYLNMISSFDEHVYQLLVLVFYMFATPKLNEDHNPPPSYNAFF